MSGRRVQRHAGIALVLVLWVVALLSTMALTLIATQRTDTSLTHNLISSARGRALAEAGVYYAIARGLLYRAAEKSEKWQPDGTAHDWEFDGTRVRLAITSEHGFIDLNQAGAELLDGLLEAVGVPSSEAPSLRDAILDWRDKNSEHLLNGAEDDAYRTAGRKYGARDAPFASVSELRQVMGMTPRIYRAMAPALTVYSGRRTIQAGFAPPLVLSALPGLDQDAVLEYLDLRASHRERGLPLPQPTGVIGGVLDQGQAQVFRIYAEAPGADGGTTRIQAIVRTAQGATPYRILAWNYNPDRPVQPQAEPSE